MADKGRVVQTVVTTETTTEYEEEESVYESIFMVLNRVNTLICMGVGILMIVTIATSPKKKKEIFSSPQNPTKMFNVGT